MYMGLNERKGDRDERTVRFDFFIRPSLTSPALVDYRERSRKNAECMNI